MGISIFGVLDIGKVSLFTNQSAMGITGHNIANVNTPGFSRQRPVFEPVTPQTIGLNQFGRGSTIASIEKSYDRFLNAQINVETNILGQYSAKEAYMMETEAIFNEANDAGLNKILSDFWNAWHDLANYPDGIPERVVLQTTGKSIVNSFQNITAELERMRTDTNNEIQTTVEKINQITQHVAELNNKIMQAQSSGANPNDYTDQRDRLLEELSQLIDFDTVQEENGQISILAAKGKILVSKNYAWRLSVQADPEKDNLYAVNYVEPNGTALDITNDIKSGALRGLLDMRDTTIPAYFDKLDLLATTLVNEVNKIHYQGIGLNGSTENYFFTPHPLTTEADEDNTGGARIYNASITDPTMLRNSDYEIQFTSQNTYRIFDVRNNEDLYYVDSINNAIVFNDDGGINDSKALLHHGTYTGEELAAELESQLEASSTTGQSYTVTYDKTSRSFTIKNDAANTNGLELLWSDAGTTGEDLLGFQSVDSSIAVGSSDVSDVQGGTYSYTSGNSLQFAGIAVTIEDDTGQPQNGDVFRVSSVHDAAKYIALDPSVSEDPENIAAAQPIFHINDTNNIIVFDDDGGAPGTYNAVLSAGDYTGKELSAEIEAKLESSSASGQSYTVVYDNATHRFTIRNNFGNAQDIDLLWDDAGSTAAQILGFDNTSADTVAVDSEVSSDTRAYEYEAGDNRNALQMAELEQQKVMENGTLSIDNFYNIFVVQVGIDTQQTSRTIDQQKFVIDNLNQRRDSISGVSLDEEMTNLIKYQQAFAASAKLISTVNEMLDLLVKL